MAEEARKLKVAAVQVVSKNGDVAGNLERAAVHVKEAARRGATLVVLPEFMPTGYVFTKRMWDAAEPAEGPTVTWLRENSRAHGVWLGTSFLEAEGEDFYNTFLITNPDGDIDGRVRKQTPAVAEAYFTKGEAGPHVITTALGRLGVGICYENMLAYTPRLMASQSVDMVLMPHSAPTPAVSPIFPASAAAAFNEHLAGLASFYASTLGVPAVFVNKSGPWDTTVPFMPFFPQRSTFPGLSTIADSDGTARAQLGSDEGVIVEKVTLDPARKTGACPECHGRWAREVPAAINLWRLVEAMGAAWYRLSGERRRRALEVSQRPS